MPMREQDKDICYGGHKKGTTKNSSTSKVDAKPSMAEQNLLMIQIMSKPCNNQPNRI